MTGIGRARLTSARDSWTSWVPYTVKAITSRLLKVFGSDMLMCSPKLDKCVAAEQAVSLPDAIPDADRMDEDQINVMFSLPDQIKPHLDHRGYKWVYL